MFLYNSRDLTIILIDVIDKYTGSLTTADKEDNRKEDGIWNIYHK